MTHRTGVLSTSLGESSPTSEHGAAPSVGVHRDVADFEVIFNRYYPPLCSFAFRYVESEAVAEELVQEVFLYIWRSRVVDSLPSDHLHRYLYSAVRNAAMSHLRHRRVEERSAPDIVRIQPSPPTPDSATFTPASCTALLMNHVFTPSMVG